MHLMSDDEVLKSVRELVRGKCIRYVHHAEIRMAERGFDRGQVAECLLKGYFVERPVIPNRSGDIEYKFTIEANVDGELIDVVAALRPHANVVVITVIDPK